MISQLIAPILFFLSVQVNTPDLFSMPPQVLASKSISLENRYPNSYVSNIFKDNILLNIAYLNGRVTKASHINWEDIEKPFQSKFTLSPGKTFAFHDDVLPEFENKVVLTTKAHFNYDDGFKSDGYLTGDGVCHLASLMYWAAKAAGLDAYAPTNHDFMPIPEIPKEFGVAIYDVPGQGYSNQRQNLYIINNQKKEITFEFDYNGKDLKFTVEE